MKHMGHVFDIFFDNRLRHHLQNTCGLSRSNHLDSHEQKTFACGQCTKQFFSKSRLDDHINQAHSKSNKCGQFSHYSSLNRHTKQAHEGVKIGVCKFCKKEFNKRSLERHEDQCKVYRCFRTIITGSHYY